jgi:hypothetical protein
MQSRDFIHVLEYAIAPSLFSHVTILEQVKKLIYFIELRELDNFNLFVIV